MLCRIFFFERNSIPMRIQKCIFQNCCGIPLCHPDVPSINASMMGYIFGIFAFTVSP